MRIFVTGATGFVGSAIVSELLSAGHQVLGLARSDESEKSLLALGAGVHRGDMNDLESLRRGAAISDGVIHAAFDHDFSKFAEKCELDRLAIESIGEVLKGSDRPFVVTSGLPATPGDLATEADLQPSSPGGMPRMSEQTALSLVEQGVRASVVRMSQVHDLNKQGFATYMIAHAREKGVSAFIGTGLNRWPAVHRLDAAVVYRLAFEKGAAAAIYHAIADEGVAVRGVAESIGRGLNLPVLALAPEDAAAHFGWLARPVGMDAPASSARTQQLLGWYPTKNPGFIADLERSNAFFLAS
jgi:nucleoside-diphosphate-sugar epimerase